MAEKNVNKTGNIRIPTEKNALSHEIVREYAKSIGAARHFYPDLTRLVIEGRRSGQISFSFVKGTYTGAQLTKILSGLKLKFQTTEGWVNEHSKGEVVYDTLTLRIPAYRLGDGTTEEENENEVVSYEDDFEPPKILEMPKKASNKKKAAAKEEA